MMSSPAVSPALHVVRSAPRGPHQPPPVDTTPHVLAAAHRPTPSLGSRTAAATPRFGRSSGAGTPVPRLPPGLPEHAPSSPAITPSPPAPSVAAPPLSVFWQQQLELLDVSRHSNQMHHHARAAAVAARAASAGTSPMSVRANGLRTEQVTPNASVASTVPTPVSTPAHVAIRSSETSSALASSDSLASSPSVDPARKDERNSSSIFSPWSAIDLGGVGLRALAPELWEYTFLTRLYVNHNRLTVLPRDLGKLRNLEVLDASGNQLVTLPPQMGTLTSLQEVFLFDNELSTLPYELGMLYKLDFIGLAGNPLAHELVVALRNDGPRSLIRLLRDQTPAPPKPTPRAWVAVEDPTGDALGRTEALCVLTYNVLADNLASDEKYGYTPSWALKWAFRKGKILDEITSHEADIVCLQEVGLRQFDEFFLPALSAHGFRGIYHAKSRIKTMNPEEKARVDGCAVFYRDLRWHLAQQLVVEYSRACLSRSELGDSDDVFNRVMPRDQVGVVCCFESRTTGGKVIVANTHLCWDPAYSDVKTIQMAMLLDNVASAGSQFAAQAVKTSLPIGVTAPSYTSLVQVPTFICGDFNSDPDSAVIELLATGKLRGDHPDFRQKTYGTMTTDGLEHNLVLASSYAQADGGARLSSRPGQGELLPFTNFTPEYKDVLDYIFFNRRAVRVIALLGPVDPTATVNHVGFPSAHFPSDHIPIACRYLLLLPHTKTASTPNKSKTRSKA